MSKRTEPRRELELEWVPLKSLRPHPRNYLEHPEEELEHLRQSITEHGIYKNVVVAKDGTILAGHGVCQAAGQLEREEIPVKRMPFGPSDPRALRLVAADNEIARGAQRNEKELASILKELREHDEKALLGTGYNDKTLAALVARMNAGLEGISAAAEWVGMPECENETLSQRVLIVHFTSDEDVNAFCQLIGQQVTPKTKSIWFPAAPRDDTTEEGYVDGDT